MKAFIQRILALFLALFSALGISLKTPEVPAVKPSENDIYVLDGSKVTFAFSSNPSTGYTWEVQQEGTTVKQTKEWFESGTDERGDIAVAGRSGTQFYTYEAVAEGKTTLTFNYLRPWETEGPIKTYTVYITADKALQITDVSIDR